MVNEDKQGHGNKRMARDENKSGKNEDKDEPVFSNEDEASAVNEGLDTNTSEGKRRH